MKTNSIFLSLFRHTSNGIVSSTTVGIVQCDSSRGTALCYRYAGSVQRTRQSKYTSRMSRPTRGTEKFVLNLFKGTRRNTRAGNECATTKVGNVRSMCVRLLIFAHRRRIFPLGVPTDRPTDGSVAAGEIDFEKRLRTPIAVQYNIPSRVYRCACMRVYYNRFRVGARPRLVEGGSAFL